MCLFIILNNKLDLNQETRFTIVMITLMMSYLLVSKTITGTHFKPFWSRATTHLNVQISADGDFDFCNLQTETLQAWLGFLSPESVSFLFDDGSILHRITPDPERDPSVQNFVRNVFRQSIDVMEEPLRYFWCFLLKGYTEKMVTHTHKKKSLKIKWPNGSDWNFWQVNCSFILDTSTVPRLRGFIGSKMVQLRVCRMHLLGLFGGSLVSSSQTVWSLLRWPY